MPERPVRHYNPWVEGLSRDQLEALQLRKLKQTLEWAYHRSPFYRRKLREAGVSPDDVQTLEDFRRRVPLTTKEDLLADQEEHPPFGSRLALDPAAVRRYYTTSGTSGRGQEVHALTSADLEFTATWAYGFHWAGVHPGDVFANMVPLSTGNFAGPDSVVKSAIRHGMNLLQVGTRDTEDRLRWMQRFGAKFVYTSPSYLNRLTSAAAELGIEPRSFGLEGILVTAEAFPSSWATRMQDVWGTTIHEMYGCTATLTCVAVTAEEGVAPGGEQGFMRILEHVLHSDVVDPATSELAEDGQDGEVVLTPLERQAMPILRFQTSDRAIHVSHRNGVCGRPFDGWACGEITRYDDMVKVRNSNIWPSTVDHVMFGRPEVAEYRALVTETGSGSSIVIDVELHPHVSSGDRAALLTELGAELKRTTGVTMELRDAPDPLPRHDMKPRRWTDRRQEGLAAIGDGSAR